MIKLFLTCILVYVSIFLNPLKADNVGSSEQCGCGGKNRIQQYENWVKSLPRSYIVRKGNAYILTNQDCLTFIELFRSCFADNPAAPYIIPQVPIENSYVDPYYAAPLNTPGPDGPNELTNIIYRIGNHEALITMVQYPPKAAYLGYQSYVFTRLISYYDGVEPPRPRTISPNQDRYELFASIGNDVNNVIVQNKIGCPPWEKAIVVYITTSNKILAKTLKDSAKNYGINPKSIFVEPIGSNVITGNTRLDDDLVTLIRYAVPESQLAADEWMNNLAENVLVYKVSAPTIEVSRYGENEYTPHKINNIERTPSLKKALNQLTQLLANYLTEKQASPSKFKTMIRTTKVNKNGVPYRGFVGSYCIKYGLLAAGDNQDTSTYATGRLANLRSNEVAFVAGVDHNVIELNNSHYVSVGIYNAEVQAGIGSSSQTNPRAVGFDRGKLTGSALGILQDLNIEIPLSDHQLRKNIDKLYVTALTRDINNPTISAAKKYCINLEGTSLINKDAAISITERSYILPGETAGGNDKYMLYPNIIASENNFNG